MGGRIHPTGFEQGKKNTGRNGKADRGGNAGGNIRTHHDDQGVDELLRIWYLLDDQGRRDLMAVAKGLAERVDSKQSKTEKHLRR
jgi:hypothetical protein